MQNDKIEITPAVAADLEAIVEIEALSGLSHWGIENYKSEMAKNETLFFVARVEEKIVGFVLASLITPVVEIFNIAVLPNLREEGIGRRLFEKIIERAIENKCRECWLEVRESNLAARRFYEKLKFRNVGQRKNYYQLPTEDAFLMEYKITDEP